MSNEGFRNVPGVPDGWELVRVGRPVVGDFVVHTDGRVLEHGKDSCVRMNENYPIIRKIEQPAKYRPFANAEEYKPHRDRWVTRIDISDDEAQPGACRVGAYDDQGVWWNNTQYQTWQTSFDAGRCFDDDGTPFGVRIDE
jgi:hypothetical protein